MDKPVMIVGAGGYIGSVTTYLFLESGYKVVAVDNFSTGYEAPLKFLESKFPGQLKIVKADITQPLDQVFNQNPDVCAVVHFAASCSVNESMENPAKYFINNVGGSTNLLKTMLDHGIKNVVFSSTCAVYGEARYVPVDEAHPTDPKNPYGESKLMVEKMIRWLGELKGLNSVILRYFNVCGASDDGEIGDSKRPSSLLVQNAVRGALGIEEFKLTCPEVDTPDKTPIRDYINVVDLGQAHLKAVEYLLNGGQSQTINLGTGQGNSVKEVVDLVQKVTGKQFEIGQTTPRAGEYAKMIASIEKAQSVLGWKPQRSIEDSIQALVKWYSKYPHGWE